MADDGALLNDVISKPDEDGPRLAYAVWLRHHSNSSDADAARAELIRLQIELETVGDDDRSWPEKARRERELLALYQTAWERPLRALLVPSLRKPGSWLHAQLFGRGGKWGFRRGFVEEVLATAAGFLQDDVQLFGASPLRQVVLTNASPAVGALANDERLDRLRSLHLVSDAEFDEEMELLAESAGSAGLTVLELRIPRIDSDLSGLLAVLRGAPDDAGAAERKLEEFRAWDRASAEEQARLRKLAASPRFVQRLTEPLPTSEAEILAANEWVYLGTGLQDARVWAVAKTYHDLEDETGLCRRLALFKPGRFVEPALEALRRTTYFHAERSRQ